MSHVPPSPNKLKFSQYNREEAWEIKNKPSIYGSNNKNRYK